MSKIRFPPPAGAGWGGGNNDFAHALVVRSEHGQSFADSGAHIAAIGQMLLRQQIVGGQMGMDGIGHQTSLVVAAVVSTLVIRDG